VKCPHCNREIPDFILHSHIAGQIGQLGGQARSRAKTRAARRNARLGGWPKGRKRRQES